MRRTAAALLLIASLAAAGCGEEESGSRPSSARLVLPGKPPLVNSFQVDPDDGSFLLSTNKGFYRVDADGKKDTRLDSKVSARGTSAPVGTFLAFEALGQGRLIGAGHPDSGDDLPQFLGFMTSGDGGKSWKVESRLGLADLHVLHSLHDRIYAFDAVVGALLISEDEGRNWTEHPTPRELIGDFVVDPQDPDYVLAASDDTLFRSEDGGDSWRPLIQGQLIRLLWPAPGKLFMTDGSGRVQRSDDRGERWRDVGRIDGEPWRLAASPEGQLHAALSDGTIVKSADEGGQWDELFRP
jgi:hypothetical protein